MPTGCLTSWPSMMNSCGSTSSSRWSVGMFTALAVSITRRTSFCVTSRSLIATMPSEFCPRMWLPVIPVMTWLMRQSAISSASFSAAWIDCTVASMSTTTPRRMPAVAA
ncbi:hypothetical protein GALL_405660 [mine drainage metagenome]|uniref:Uncharacterized protein n=1 Tax=mine drainage metagenome TaxID=410659 RepID=A0A1J5QCM4_9ZZZZ